MKRALGLAAAFALSAPLLSSEGAAYLKVPQGAASSAMGSAMVGMRGVESLWYTPAGLARLRTPQIALSRNAWLGQTRNDYLAGALPVGSSGGIGAWANYVGSEDVYRDASGQDTGSFGVYDLSGGLACGWSLGSLALGLGGKYFQEHVEKLSSASWAVDLGTQIELGTPRARLGLAVQNLGPRLDYDVALGEVKPPLTYRAGLALVRVASFLTVLQELRMLPESGETSYLAGLETQGQAGSMTLLGRAGYDTANTQVGGGLAGFTLGAGIVLQGLHVDLAIVPYGQLGNPYRMSLGWEFAAAPAGPVVTVSASAPAPTPVAAQAPAPASKQAAFTVEMPAGAVAVGATQTYTNAAAAWDAAKAAEAAGDKAKARSAYEAGCNLEPSNAEAWGRLGKFEYEQGEKAAAVDAFDKMLQLKPDDSIQRWLQDYRSQP